MRDVAHRMSRFLLVLPLVAGLASWSLATERKAALSLDAAAVEARLLDDVKFLAGDECEGRGVNTQGINKAAGFIADEFKKAGLKPAFEKDSYFQHFKIAGGSKLGETNTVTLTGPKNQKITLEMGKDFTVCGASGSGKVEAEIVFAGYGVTSKEPAYDDFADIDVAGKIVVVIRRLPQPEDPKAKGFPGGEGHPAAALVAKIANAEIHKAAAVIFVNDNTLAAQNQNADRLMDFRTLAMGQKPAAIPAVHLRRSQVNEMISGNADEDLSAIEKRINKDFKPWSFPLKGWKCSMEVNVTRTLTEVKNVIGVLEGAGPLAQETVVIGAHYDHLGFGGAGGRPLGKDIHYGADDNASGTASLIELARRFGAMEGRKGRRLVFIAFTAEEIGLLGSAHYCENPVFPLADTVAMINMDMIGRLRDEQFTLYGTGTAKEFDDHVEALNQKYRFKIKKIATGYGPSDHQSFYVKKIPVFHYFTNTHPQYHKPTDTVDTINVEGIRRITEMIEESVQAISTWEKRPTYVEIKRTPGGGGPRGPKLGFTPSYGDDKDGVLIDEVAEDGPAGKAGLRKGDRIMEIGGKPTKNLEAYMAVMAGHKLGDTIEVTIIRDGKEEKVKVKLE